MWIPVTALTRKLFSEKTLVEKSYLSPYADTLMPARQVSRLVRSLSGNFGLAVSGKALEPNRYTQAPPYAYWDVLGNDTT